MTTSSPMLALVPGTIPVPGPGANTGLLSTWAPTTPAGSAPPGSRCSSPTAACAATRGSRAPARHGRWIPAASPSSRVYGSWDHGPTPRQYIARIRRYRDEIGHLAWAAPQDWMCEPFITARTGFTVAEHQRRTVANFLTLRSLSPDLPIVPVLQGWTITDYLHCADLYERAGINLAAEPLVGLGSVCRRQATTAVHTLITVLHERGITRLHGFGFKIQGLIQCGHLLASADSMAWSYAARRHPPLPGCETRHINCANCPRYAYRWYSHVRASLTWPRYTQPTLFSAEGGAA